MHGEDPEDPVAGADYALFLEEYGLADNPRSRELFARYHQNACRFVGEWDEDCDEE